MSKVAQSQAPTMAELQAVSAVAAARSFRRAASELGVSASALSHAVAALERRLGVRFFVRTTRSVSLTEAGERFLGQVRPALSTIAEAVEGVNDFRDTPSGTLRINAPISAMRRIFEPVVLPFMQRYPDVHVDIVSEARLVDIVAAGFDAGIRLADSVPRDMVAVPCSPPIRFVVVASPGYLSEHGRPRTPADLHAHACIRRRMPSGALLRWELEKGREALALDVNGTLTLDADELMVAAAERGFGLAWVNEWSVEASLAAGRLARVLEDWSPPFPGICLYYPPHRHVSAALRAFVAMLRERGATDRRGRRPSAGKRAS